MDEVFEYSITPNQVAATYVCACNPRKIPHYPKDWYASSLYATHPILVYMYLMFTIALTGFLKIAVTLNPITLRLSRGQTTTLHTLRTLPPPLPLTLRTRQTSHTTTTMHLNNHVPTNFSILACSSSIHRSI